MKDKYVYDEETGNFNQKVEQTVNNQLDDKYYVCSSSEKRSSKVLECIITFVCSFIALTALGYFLWSCNIEVLLLVSAIVSLILTVYVFKFE